MPPSTRASISPTNEATSHPGSSSVETPSLAPSETNRDSRQVYQASQHQNPGPLSAHLDALRRSRPSLWRAAFERLDGEDRKFISSFEVNERDYLEETLELATHCKDACQGKGLEFQANNKVFIRDLAEKILLWVERFKETGNIVGQYDTYNAALPWAGMRLILQIALRNTESLKVAVFAVENITGLLLRCRLYELYYVHREPKFSNDNLAEALTQLDVAILSFLASTERLLERDNTDRVPQGPLGEEEIKSRLDILDELESSVQKEVCVEDTEIKDLKNKLSQIFDVHNNIFFIINDIFSTILRELEEKKERKVLTWISTIKYKKHHVAATDGFLAGSGDWLVAKPVFREWQASKVSSMLWLRGEHGTGKTKLTSHVINTLRSLPNNNPHGVRNALAYFYCKSDERDRQDTTKIMQCLVKQLCKQLPWRGLPVFVTDEYDARQRNGLSSKLLGFQDCQNLIFILLGMYPVTTIVIDAFDEISHRSRGNFLEALNAFVQASGVFVKIFVSSRDKEDIVLKLRDIPNIYIGADNLGSIKAFVDREIDRCIENRRLLDGHVDEQLKHKIISTLSQEPDKMFSWVDLQIKNLCELLTQNEVEEELENLPMDLETTYSRIYNRIQEETPWAVKALMWILAAQKPLSPGEWLDGVSWALLEPGGELPEFNMHVLLEICQNLVVHDSQQGVVRFAHLSVREFLSNSLEQQAFEVTAQACLAVLQHSDTLSAQPASSADFKPFHRYSVRYWPEHLQLCGWNNPRSKLPSLLRDFMGSFTTPAEAYIRWFKAATLIMRDYDYVGYGFQVTIKRLTSNPPNPLLAAAYFGFAEGCGLWEGDSFEPNFTNHGNQTPLYLASHQGHAAVVRLLIEHGADIHHLEHADGNDPLFATLRNDHADVLEILLSAGAVFESSRYGSGILAGASVGGRKVMDLLLSRGVNLTEGVITAAVVNNDRGEEVTKLLLARDPNIDVTEALATAAANGNEKIVRLLLSATFEVNRRLADGRMALYEAVAGGNINIVKLFLEAGADIYAELPDGKLILDAVRARGNKKMAALLEDDIRIAVTRGYSDIVKGLLAKDQDNIKKRDDMGRNLLHLACFHGRTDILDFLLGLKVLDVNAQDLVGLTPLHLAVSRGNKQLLNQLLEAKPDTEILDHAQKTPLQIAVDSEKVSSVKQLLRSGAKIDGIRMEKWRHLYGAIKDGILFSEHGRIKTIRKTTVTIDYLKESIARLAGESLVRYQYNCNNEAVQERQFCNRKASAIGIETNVQSRGLRSQPSTESEDQSLGEIDVLGLCRCVYPGVYMRGSFPGEVLGDCSGKPAEIVWLWLPRIRHKATASEAVPQFSQVKTSPDTAVLLCYVSFGYAVVESDENAQNFEFSRRYSKISWVMFKSRPEKLNRTRPSEGTGRLNKSVEFLESRIYLSSLEFGWLPDHGIEFFSLFVKDLVNKWSVLFERIRAHLAETRSRILKEQGRQNRVIQGLLKDAQRWTELTTLLKSHIVKAEEFIVSLKQNPFLCAEALPENQEPVTNSKSSIAGMFDEQKVSAALRPLVAEVEKLKLHEKLINGFDQQTKEMIQLEFNLVSIYDSYRSVSMAEESAKMATSMKRLSWITFIFLPLMFTASLFGMNVNLLRNNPNWLWYLLAGILVQVMVTSVWMFLKYSAAERNVEKGFGDAISRIRALFQRDQKQSDEDDLEMGMGKVKMC